MRHLITAAVPFLLLASCERGEAPAMSAEIASARSPARDDTAESAQQTQVRRIVRTGEVHVAVADLAAARAGVLDATRGAGGYVAEDRAEESGRTVQRMLRVRVPAASFEALVAAVEKLGTVEAAHVTADDVTTQWVDVDARVRAKRQMETRYLELVARAANVAEVMQVERELGLVRAEIEAMESKLRALGDQVALSTLTITLCAPRTSLATVDATDFAASMSIGWSVLMRTLAVILTAWPALALAALAIVVRRVRRARVPSLPSAS